MTKDFRNLIKTFIKYCNRGMLHALCKFRNEYHTDLSLRINVSCPGREKDFGEISRIGHIP
jgi:hypothetical protein